MQKHDEVESGQQSFLLAASVHQVRQPLYVIQNTLFAASFLADRQETSPDLKLIQEALSEMRAAGDRLSLTISVIAGIAKPEDRGPVETVLTDLTKEAFEMVSFGLRNEYESVNYEIPTMPSGPTETVLLDYPKVLLALIRWILETASNPDFRGDQDQPESLLLSSFSEKGDMTVRITNSRRCREVRLGQFIHPKSDNQSTSN
ncbi:MAG: hypothetical protein WCH39_13495 [Schlesneria sp.]